MATLRTGQRPCGHFASSSLFMASMTHVGCRFLMPARTCRVPTSCRSSHEHRKPIRQALPRLAPSQPMRPRPQGHCPCVPQHNNLRGVDATDHFISASSSTLGERFWDGLSSSLRDGGTSISTFRSTSSSSSWSPLLAVSLASGACPLRMFNESWKHGTFTPSKAAEVLSSEGIASYFRSSAPSCLSTTTRSPLSSAWLRHSSSTSASPPTVSPPIVPDTPTAYVPGSSRSRTPRTTKAPLALLRSRRDGRDGVLTGALRRSRSVRLVPCDLTPCVVFFCKKIILDPNECPHTLCERRDTLRGFQVTWPEWCGHDVGWTGTLRWDQR